jgi:deoxyadenosine/deoxycytidine kinase
MTNPKYLAVAGNIGCGKSTLVDFICRTFDVAPFFEPNATNPYLADFYADMKAWAFHSQIYFLSHKFRIHQQLGQQLAARTVVQDRTIFEDAEVFAAYLHRRRFIDKRDWGVYQDLYQTILNAIEPPHLLIYLRAPVRTIRKRVQMRGRPEEQQIPADYLRSLNALYESWYEGYGRSPSIVLETDKLDYVTDLIHRIDLLKTIEKHLA